MHPEEAYGQAASAAPHPLAELLACPPETGRLLHDSTRLIEVAAGETVFRQGERCEGLYVIVSGELVRKANRKQTRLTLGRAKAGELLELAAALGDGHHTYTLTTLTTAQLLVLPMASLEMAFEAYPPLRMQLLEELAREVSRAYNSCRITRMLLLRQHPGAHRQS